MPNLETSPVESASLNLPTVVGETPSAQSPSSTAYDMGSLELIALDALLALASDARSGPTFEPETEQKHTYDMDQTQSLETPEPVSSLEVDSDLEMSEVEEESDDSDDSDDNSSDSDSSDDNEWDGPVSGWLLRRLPADDDDDDMEVDTPIYNKQKTAVSRRGESPKSSQKTATSPVKSSVNTKPKTEPPKVTRKPVTGPAKNASVTKVRNMDQGLSSEVKKTEVKKHHTVVASRVLKKDPVQAFKDQWFKYIHIQPKSLRARVSFTCTDGEDDDDVAIPTEGKTGTKMEVESIEVGEGVAIPAEEKAETKVQVESIKVEEDLATPTEEKIETKMEVESIKVEEDVATPTEEKIETKMEVGESPEEDVVTPTAEKIETKKEVESTKVDDDVVAPTEENTGTTNEVQSRKRKQPDTDDAKPTEEVTSPRRRGRYIKKSLFDAKRRHVSDEEDNDDEPVAPPVQQEPEEEKKEEETLKRKRDDSEEESVDETESSPPKKARNPIFVRMSMNNSIRRYYSDGEVEVESHENTRPRRGSCIYKSKRSSMEDPIPKHACSHCKERGELDLPWLSRYEIDAAANHLDDARGHLMRSFRTTIRLSDTKIDNCSGDSKREELRKHLHRVLKRQKQLNDLVEERSR
ncbi:hypothetical protein HK102_006275, partial [Quaeritorhiza haematococci]